VPEDGDALLTDVDRDEELALRRRKRRPARRDAATRGRARGARLLALRPLLLLLGLLGVSLRLLGALSRRLGLGRLRCGPLAATPAAATSATALRLCRGAFRRDRLGLRSFLRGSGRLDRCR